MAVIASGTSLRGVRQTYVINQVINEGAPLVFTFPDFDRDNAYGDLCAWQLSRVVPGLTSAPAVFADGFIRYPLYSVRVPSPLGVGDELGIRFYYSGYAFTVETY